ncbi:uncharacterized protein DUF1569 [Dyadobacter jejuensis]|uniref:Uncharacterized protein DUF1569 n=1 Tax=Dyadobacter jejuensis TaxID=1082580 RepID=A0A316ANS8_9BACT|nr:DUF1569 domain-containing protein [Dyadobacter jejuensis]PWJ58794.1 uncharacterized protein DUF1569 [Dyadobacter jejuensis]
MALPNIFTKEVTDSLIGRIEHLTPATTPTWGKMNVGQMLAHCCVTYEYVFDSKHKKPNAFMKFILKNFVKNAVVNEKPYPRNSRTAPDFMITDERNFEAEKARLIEFLRKTQQLGAEHFDQKESHSFGVLSVHEWNNMFYKHLNHHLTQFGV